MHLIVVHQVQQQQMLNNVLKLQINNKIGYPILLKSAFAWGGLRSVFAENETELNALATKAFTNVDQVRRGWKEVEYEVVSDVNDICITVGNMENFDPLHIHTGML